MKRNPLLIYNCVALILVQNYHTKSIIKIKVHPDTLLITFLMYRIEDVK